MTVIDPGDPGPVPPEPNRYERVIQLDAYSRVVVTDDPATGLIGLSVQQAGHMVAVPLAGPAVDALRDALTEVSR